MVEHELKLINEKLENYLQLEEIKIEISDHELMSATGRQLEELQEKVKKFMEITGWVMWIQPSHDPLEGVLRILRPPTYEPCDGVCQPHRKKTVTSRIVEPKLLE